MGRLEMLGRIDGSRDRRRPESTRLKARVADPRLRGKTDFTIRAMGSPRTSPECRGGTEQRDRKMPLREQAFFQISKESGSKGGRRGRGRRRLGGGLDPVIPIVGGARG